jgi:glycosyltransferase involved in cell wall biosynthesis
MVNLRLRWQNYNSMKKISLSVALATYNEENNLARCLDAVKDIADEIVIVDGSSTDKTVNIANKYKAKVVVTDNPPIFHINKQKAIDLCKGSWILQLDADEVITKDLKKEIMEIVKNKSEISAYWIKRRNYFLGKWLKKGGQYPDPVIRFFKKGKAFLPCKSVHEQIQVDGEVGWLKNDMLHFSVPNFSRYLTNSNRYTSLTASELKEKKVTINLSNSIKYIVYMPLKTFVLLYFRHKGFMDGFPGFIFALFSGLHHTISYVKLWEKKKND